MISLLKEIFLTFIKCDTWIIQFYIHFFLSFFQVIIVECGLLMNCIIPGLISFINIIETKTRNEHGDKSIYVGSVSPVKINLAEDKRSHLEILEK